ncbi:MAG: hypothetical protein EOM59_11680 [Clostridia bacterium]|nr:hypothetical protein [Clostridia bacterium]
MKFKVIDKRTGKEVKTEFNECWHLSENGLLKLITYDKKLGNIVKFKTITENRFEPVFEPTTADKLLWLVENDMITGVSTNCIDIFREKEPDKEFYWSDYSPYYGSSVKCDNKTKAISAAYDWAQKQLKEKS